ncbi:TorA maturation chaperone TorD [Vibrio sp. ES.051]|uniref:molecular chaperone TorD family protein n=1 Tax=Vibrio sp. ES.051 TaxID=1761909 RepID=UPI000BF47D30|nr:molecular chaperone TorD family protein [Vibrio sp. ES.051]PFG45804.1 TorA maturation chaperone TorD [Vibrio sp. ES.051]
MKNIINTGKLLGTLFYHKRNKAETIELVSALVSENVLQNETLIALSALDAEQLEHDFSVLFEGMGFMPIPPWGSVYLDKEQVLFGASNTQYRLFLQQHGIALDSEQREPEDQFGLMLLAYAYLLEQGNANAAAHELIGQHLMPWGKTYLEQLSDKAPNLFYQLLAKDVLGWLNFLLQKQSIHVSQKKIYLDERID